MQFKNDAASKINKHTMFDPADFLQNGSLIKVKKSAKILLLNKKEFQKCIRIGQMRSG